MNICTICSNRQFASSDALFQHIRSSKKRHFFCDPCKEGFPGEDALNSHSEAVHSSVSCSICKLFFPNEEGLQVHYRDSSTHTSCKFCGAGFVDSNATTMHQRQHHGQSRKRRRRGCRSPSSSVDGRSVSSFSFSSMPPSSLRNSTTPESSVHTPVTVHTPLLDDPVADGIWPEREDDVTYTIPQEYVSPLRPTVNNLSSSQSLQTLTAEKSPEELAIPVPIRVPMKPLLRPVLRTRSTPEHSPLEPQPLTPFSPSWLAGPSQEQLTSPKPFGTPVKTHLRPELKGSSDADISPLEPQLLSQFANPSTPLLEAEMPLPPTEVRSGQDEDEDAYDLDWEDPRPVIPPILAEDDADVNQDDVGPTEEHLSETGHPSEYVNPFVDDSEMNVVLANINTNVTTVPGPSSTPDTLPTISPVVAPSRQFSMTLPIIREASDIPLPSESEDGESEDGHEPKSSHTSDFQRAFAEASDHSPIPSLHSLPSMQDAFDGGDDFSDYVGSSACPSPLDTTYLTQLARQMCHARSEGSMYFPDPFADYGSSRATSPEEQVHAIHGSSAPHTTMLDVHDEVDEYVGHENNSNDGDARRGTDNGYDTYGRHGQGYGDYGRGRQDHDDHELGGSVYDRHEDTAPLVAPARQSSTQEDKFGGNDRVKEWSSSCVERSTEHLDSPQGSRRSSPLRLMRREGLDPHSDAEGSQSNVGSASGRTSRHSRSSSRSFNRSLDDETRMTSPMSPKDESPLLESMSLQNPRGPRFHCRLCMVDPCEEATATFCGHIFCYSCITGEIMETSRCPVCNAPTLLYCLFKLDLHA